jgi:hypothetical protein
MKTALFSLLAVACLCGANALADASCRPQATLSCATEYGFASGSALPGPTVSGGFKSIPDDSGSENCSAAADLKVADTGIELDASIMDLGDNQMSFSLFTIQGDKMSNTDFDQIGTNEYRATVTPTHPGTMMANGRLDKLEQITYTCDINQPARDSIGPKISCELLYDIDGASDDDLDVPTHVQVVNHSDLYGFSVRVDREKIVATLTDKQTHRAVQQITRIADFHATPYMPQSVVSTSVTGKTVESGQALLAVEVSCSPVSR